MGEGEVGEDGGDGGRQHDEAEDSAGGGRNATTDSEGGGGGGRQPRPRFVYHKTGEIASGVDGASSGVSEGLREDFHGGVSGFRVLGGGGFGGKFGGLGLGEIWEFGKSITNPPLSAKKDEKKFRPQKAMIFPPVPAECAIIPFPARLKP